MEMIARLAGAAIVLTVVAACGQSEDRSVSAAPAAPEQMAMEVVGDVAACQPVERMPLEGRPSPYDSTMVNLNGAVAKVCYGRPSMRDRQIFGGLVAYDTLWRTGANEPTTIHLNAPTEIAGMRVEPGSYTIYTVPGETHWEIIVNRSTSQWGIESAYTPEVRAQEVGRAHAMPEQIAQPVETFTITGESTGPSTADLVLEWENTRVRIPLRRV